MPATSGSQRRHPNSPFEREAEPDIEDFALGDRVSHDSYGMGRVVSVDARGVMVDFGGSTVRTESPFRKMTKI